MVIAERAGFVKYTIANDKEAFFDDSALDIVRPRIVSEFRVLAEHLENGGDVVWPRDGVGTGLARLDEKAPRVAAFIERCRAHLHTFTQSG